MVGAVLHQELLLGARRNRLHVFRWVYAGWLVLQVLYFYSQFQGEEFGRAVRSMTGGSVRVNRASAPEVVGGRFAEMFVRQQMLVLALLTPAFVAGAITDEKRRGTLQYLLLSDLDTRHIILGKLLGRVAQVGLVALGGLPLFALLAGFGGVDPVPLLASVLVLILPLFGLAAASLLASALCRQTRDAVLALYVAGVAGGLAVWGLGGVLSYFDPLYALEPVWGPSGSADLAEGGRRLLASAGCWGALGAACVGLAVWRLRPSYVGELEGVRPSRAGWYGAERPPVSDEPVRWREGHVEGLAPNPALRRVPTWAGVSLVAGLTCLSSLTILWLSLTPGKGVPDVLRPLLQLNLHKAAEVLPNAGVGFLVQGVVAMLLAGLVVGIRCSGAVTGERERQTWEALLLTPLSAKQIVWGKLWGVMGASLWYLLAYAAPAVMFATLGGPLALLWTVLCLGVTLLCMYFIGAAGLWCSVRSRNSWRALLGTMLVGYAGGCAIYLVTSPVTLLVALLLLLVLVFVDMATGTRLAPLCLNNSRMFFRLFFAGSCIALVGAFWLTARWFLTGAQRWIADRERTRHWYEEPVYRRARRPRVELPRPAR
jgi:ABC-type transport system involved in multi-copper enzyme maturation permease subunit